MTMRDKELQAQREYRQLMNTLETKKPAGSVFTICAENGSLREGMVIYSPDTDTLEIELSSRSFQFEGKYIRSINQALNRLLSEAGDNGAAAP